jgi:hypothetical protein
LRYQFESAAEAGLTEGFRKDLEIFIREKRAGGRPAGDRGRRRAGGPHTPGDALLPIAEANSRGSW